MEKSDSLKSPESNGSVNSSIHYQTPPYYCSSPSSDSSPLTGIASLRRRKPPSLPPKSAIYNPVLLTPPPPSSSSTVLTLEERDFYMNLLIEYTKLENLYALCCTYAEMSSNDREILEHENVTLRASIEDLENQLDLLEKYVRVSNQPVGTNTVAPSSSTPFVQGTEQRVQLPTRHAVVYESKNVGVDDQKRRSPLRDISNQMSKMR
ncbi:hypothetical protein C5167_002877 [Papaver somniferum]|uniref:Uncharacterized protein n=1 Tax=Papaver somniferum TaxID=3469 RepID=A0A4Y7L1Y6_PAPSO|nr:uncharacterized protein LOC113313546 [Papaver somniferum]RZC78662.1 hypothetical protein C5167_002877 [Papaver somniferum]